MNDLRALGCLHTMQTLTVKTDLHCQRCVDKIEPTLNANKDIQRWNVDLDQEIKTLTVTGAGVSVELINELLNQSGYHVKENKNDFWKNAVQWKRASFNTLNCLIGCSIGDFGMVFFLQAYYPETPLLWQMILAIIAGLITSVMLEAGILKFRENFSWSFAFTTAFGMSFISMVAMELAMTSTDFMITGGKVAFANPLYWLALIPALIVGFLTPLPYNYYKLKKFNVTCHGTL